VHQRAAGVGNGQDRHPVAAAAVLTDHIERAPSQLIAYARELGVRELRESKDR